MNTVSVEALILFISPIEENGSAWVDDVSFAKVEALSAPSTVGPAGLVLHQNSPNPFNPRTRIQIDVAEADQVQLSIYDVAGRWVTTLQDGQLAAGTYSFVWGRHPRQR